MPFSSLSLDLDRVPCPVDTPVKGAATGIHAGERKSLGSYRKGRVCWRKESSDLSVEAQGQHPYFYFSRFMYAFTIESSVGLRCHAEGTMFLPGPSECLSCFISLTPFLSKFPLLLPRATQATLPTDPCVPVQGSVCGPFAEVV